jgi:protein-S-isoprenylcysteine O-methyltransferase Ste14
MLQFPKPYADAVARLRVTCGFVLVAAFAWFSQPSFVSLAVGWTISLCGLALRAWAAGCLYKDRDLATRGPYAYTRNPLYLGTLIVAAGFVVAARSVWLGLLFAAVFTFIYLPAIQLEQQHLHDLFPQYPAYAQRVPMLIPRFSPGMQGGDPFTWAQYKKNREYQAAIGFAVGFAWLVVKWLWINGRV